MRTSNANAQASTKAKRVRTSKEKKDELENLLKINPSEIFMEDEEFVTDTFYAELYGNSIDFRQNSIRRCYAG
jgi:hypothetical protein